MPFRNEWHFAGERGFGPVFSFAPEVIILRVTRAHARERTRTRSAVALTGDEGPELGVDVVFTTDEQWFLRTTDCQRNTSVPRPNACDG